MTITQVRYVCEIAKSGSMTKAANRFFISQPALSEQMKALEAELGCTLFRRTARGTELTEAGERFCREAEPVVRIWENFEHSCTVLKEMPWGTARIGFGLRARSNGLFEPIVGFVD
ncbi:MAG: LysR family transcriptional regulator, partial [Lachnospiraceae bacterium]|nr:LysR family transcriptional regulator [Lachnospiraceae bacterium]